MSMTRAVTVLLLGALAQGCAARRCVTRVVERVELRWELTGCATGLDSAAGFEAALRAENLAGRERKIPRSPLRFSYAHGLGTAAPTSSIAEPSEPPPGEPAGYTTLGAGEAFSVKRRLLPDPGGELAPARKGERVYVGASAQTPADANVSDIDLGEFIVSLDEEGAPMIALGREPIAL